MIPWHYRATHVGKGLGLAQDEQPNPQLRLCVDLGFHVATVQSFYLDGVIASEPVVSAQLVEDAHEWIRRWLQRAYQKEGTEWPLQITVNRYDGHEYEAKVYRPSDHECLNHELLKRSELVYETV